MCLLGMLRGGFLTDEYLRKMYLHVQPTCAAPEGVMTIPSHARGGNSPVTECPYGQ